MNDKKIGLAHNGSLYEMKIRHGSLGPAAIDISALYKDQALFTYDPSFTSTASCQSRITFIDGDKGVLLYGGYPIEVLASEGNFLETAYLLLEGELPDRPQLEAFNRTIAHRRAIPERALGFLNGFDQEAHPMAILLGMVGALSAYYMSAADVTDAQERQGAALDLIAKLPTVAAQAYRFSQGLSPTAADPDADLVSDFLRMCFEGQSGYRENPLLTRALDRIFILHADHEQNVSTSTVRLAGSSDTHPFSCIAAGIACLWGPSHGGANEAALNMLSEIGSVENIPHFIERAKDKNDPFRLMGFGHRIYRHYDPRATLMQQTCHEVLNELGQRDDPIFEVAMALEKHALSDSYFIEKKLYPNIDFYSGITLKAMGFPTNMFTVLFAVARTAGWIAQWKEMIEDPEQRIGRPRQIYIGPKARRYASIDARNRVSA